MNDTARYLHALQQEHNRQAIDQQLQYACDLSAASQRACFVAVQAMHAGLLSPEFVRWMGLHEMFMGACALKLAHHVEECGHESR